MLWIINLAMEEADTVDFPNICQVAFCMCLGQIFFSTQRLLMPSAKAPQEHTYEQVGFMRNTHWTEPWGTLAGAFRKDHTTGFGLGFGHRQKLRKWYFVLDRQLRSDNCISS